MKFLKYFLTGLFFGITLTKAQVISWYRIFEMFHFDAFHLYGVIGSAVVVGVTGVALIKRFKLRSIDGAYINFTPKQKTTYRYLIGGIIFGLGWALTGACPGPIYALIGNGFGVFLIVLLSALLGTLVYGLVRNRLPH